MAGMPGLLMCCTENTEAGRAVAEPGGAGENKRVSVRGDGKPAYLRWRKERRRAGVSLYMRQRRLMWLWAES